MITLPPHTLTQKHKCHLTLLMYITSLIVMSFDSIGNGKYRFTNNELQLHNHPSQIKLDVKMALISENVIYCSSIK